MGDVARAPLTVASYAKCSRLLSRGEVKRVTQRGPLVGYVIACPACGFSAPYLDGPSSAGPGAGYVEDPPAGPLLVPGTGRILVRTTNDSTCFRCKRALRVRDGVVEAEAP